MRSGLAHRRNPALVKLGDVARARVGCCCATRCRCSCCSPRSGWRSPSRRCSARSSRRARAGQVPISTVQTLAKQHEIASALLLDHDSRVEAITTAATPPVPSSGAASSRRPQASDEGRRASPAVGDQRRPAPRRRHAGCAGSAERPARVQRLWAAYPASGAQTQQLSTNCRRAARSSASISRRARAPRRSSSSS